MTGNNVLKLDAEKEQARYRAAIATILRDIKRDADCKWIDIAEAIDVSVGTITNAKEGLTDLSAIYLMRLGRRYGAAYLNPYLKLADAQAAPLDGSLASDILPLVLAVGHKIASARDPEGPGGAAEVPQERMGYLPDLKLLNHATGKLVKHIEEQYA